MVQSDKLPHLVLVEKCVGRFSQQQISISQNEIQSEASLQAWLEIYARNARQNRRLKSLSPALTHVLVAASAISDLNPYSCVMHDVAQN
jgi:hypothetical protein